MAVQRMGQGCKPQQPGEDGCRAAEQVERQIQRAAGVVFQLDLLVFIDIAMGIDREAGAAVDFSMLHGRTDEGLTAQHPHREHKADQQQHEQLMDWMPTNRQTH